MSNFRLYSYTEMT